MNKLMLMQRKGVTVNEEGIVFIEIDGNKYLIDSVKEVYRSHMQLAAKARNTDVTSRERNVPLGIENNWD